MRPNTAAAVVENPRTEISLGLRFNLDRLPFDRTFRTLDDTGTRRPRSGVPTKSSHLNQGVQQQQDVLAHAARR
jgi:hypothetical protein